MHLIDTSRSRPSHQIFSLYPPSDPFVQGGRAELITSPVIYSDSGSNFMTNRRTTPFKTGPTNLYVASLNRLIAYFQEDQMHFPPAFESRVVSSVNYCYKCERQPTVRPCGAYDMFSCFCRGNHLLCKITRALV